jgi:hypothetical protein
LLLVFAETTRSHSGAAEHVTLELLAHRQVVTDN